MPSHGTKSSSTHGTKSVSWYIMRPRGRPGLLRVINATGSIKTLITWYWKRMGCGCGVACAHAAGVYFVLNSRSLLCLKQQESTLCWTHLHSISKERSWGKHGSVPAVAFFHSYIFPNGHVIGGWSFLFVRISWRCKLQTANDNQGCLAKAEGSSIVDEPGEGWTPVRENRKREPGGFWGKSWSLTTVIFFPTRTTRSGERARFVGLFQGCTGLWTAGCWLARRLHQLKASTAMDLGISIFLIFVRCVALKNLEYCWSKLVGTYLSDLLLWTLVVGRRQQSESIEAALKEVWWTVLFLVGAIACRVA